MEKKLLLFFIMLFLFSSKIWNILYDIGKGFLYFFILIYILDYLEISIASDIKKLILSIINYDTTEIKSYVSTIMSKVYKNKSDKNESHRQMIPKE